MLTRFPRDGTRVGTPVNIAVEGKHAYFRTYNKAWKVRRIRNKSTVKITPSTFSGKPTGQAIRAKARLLNGDKASHATRLRRRKYRIMHGT